MLQKHQGHQQSTSHLEVQQESVDEHSSLPRVADEPQQENGKREEKHFAVCHPHINLSNAVVKFFPANCPSELQPMDQGVIKTLKTGHRKRLLRNITAKITTCDSAESLSKSINVLDAICWIHEAWNDVSQETIQKCFARCGFAFLEGFDKADCLLTENLEALIQDVCRLAGSEPCAQSDYVNIDQHEQVHIAEGSNWQEEIKDQTPDHTSDTTEIEPEEPVPSDKDVMNALSILKRYAAVNTSALELVARTEGVINEEL